MRLHDAYARCTPFEVAFPDPAAAAELFARVDDEAGARGLDPADLRSFLALTVVGEALRGLRGPDVGGEAIHRYATLAQHGFLFHRAGAPLWLLTVDAARRLVAGAPGPTPRLPAPAGYVQLPQHLFWVEGEGVPESVDGVAWRLDPQGSVHLLLASGIRPGRPGLSVVPVAEAPWTDAPEWLEAQVRAEEPDFASDLPGAELEGLYGLRAAGEALKLVARFTALPEGSLEGVDVRDPAPATPGDVPPSRFPFRTVL